MVSALFFPAGGCSGASSAQLPEDSVLLRLLVLLPPLLTRAKARGHTRAHTRTHRGWRCQRRFLLINPPAPAPLFLNTAPGTRGRRTMGVRKTDAEPSPDVTAWRPRCCGEGAILHLAAWRPCPPLLPLAVSNPHLWTPLQRSPRQLGLSLVFSPAAP